MSEGGGSTKKGAGEIDGDMGCGGWDSGGEMQGQKFRLLLGHTTYTLSNWYRGCRRDGSEEEASSFTLPSFYATFGE